MKLYQPASKTPQNLGIYPEPIESVWHSLEGDLKQNLAPKLHHLSFADILFITTIMNLPTAQRPWGIVTWMSDVFNISRVSLYALKERVTQKLRSPVDKLEPTKTAIPISKNRVERTVLSGTVLGKMAIRPLRTVLQESLGEKRSIGWISQFLGQAGKKAGQILDQIDTSSLGCVIVLRDETFFQNTPILLIVEPMSATILFAQATDDRKADTWGTALLIAEESGVKIAGLVEDMATMYPKSQKEADMADLPVQKDVWHIQRDGSTVLRKLSKQAYKATKKVYKLEKMLLKKWDDDVFEKQYILAVLNEESLYEQHDQFEQCLTHFVDALELVDWRSGEIREKHLNEWLFQEALKEMDKITHSCVRKFAKTLRKHQSNLLTAMDWLKNSLESFRGTCIHDMPDNMQQAIFAMVARHWRLQQFLTNGHQTFHQEAMKAKQQFQSFIEKNREYEEMANKLLKILDAACRTTSMIEGVNGLLKKFLRNHQSFRSTETLQSYLNLFVIWHNMRIFERGKRKGYSPYNLANISTDSDDWLTLLGYSAK